MSIMELISSVVPLVFHDVQELYLPSCQQPSRGSSRLSLSSRSWWTRPGGSSLSSSVCHWRSNCRKDTKMGKLHITDISSDFLESAQWKCAFLRLFCDYSNYIHVKNPSLTNQSCQTSAEENERNTCANVHLFCSKWKSWMTLPLMNPKLSFRYPPS